MTMEEKVESEIETPQRKEKEACTIIPQKASKPQQTSTAAEDIEDPCPICSCAGISSCRNCKKVSYCSKAHQKLHWKVHQEECFPLIHQYDPILGSRLIATRNIRAGEVILREKPLLTGPGIMGGESLEKGENLTKPLCLSCFRLVKSDYRCPSCLWPACGPACVQEGSPHGELECKIFTSADPGRYLPENKYGAITILRGVLLKGKDPLKWKKILDLDEMWGDTDKEGGEEGSHNSEKDSSLPESAFGQFCHEFIMKLNLFNVTDEDVQLVLRVISHRRFEVYEDPFNDVSSPHRSSVSLFYKACQATQNCVPNSSWIIQPDISQVHLRSLIPIQFGRIVTLCYADVTEGIIGRQASLGPSYSSCNKVWCECERCKDPMELGTFFSAIKCEECCSEISSGSLTQNKWVVPAIQLHMEKENGKKMRKLMWKCHECGGEDLFPPELYMQLVTSIRMEVSETLGVKGESELKLTDALVSVECSKKLIEKLEELSAKYSEKVHPNHFLLFYLESKLLDLMSTVLSGVKEVKVDNEEWISVGERFLKLCRKWLEVADVLWPGLSRQRGVLLYYYQQALMFQLVLAISRRMRGEDSEEGQEPEEVTRIRMEKQFSKILSVRKAVLEIFCFDPPESRGYHFAETVAQSCAELEILKLYISVFQNRNDIKRT